MNSECDFVRQLQRQFATAPPVRVGIGDDGAVLDCTSDNRQVIVTDMLLDGVHFDLTEVDPCLAGRKAVAVNLSDLAAMGCRPTSAFVSIAIPRTNAASEQLLTRLYEGIGGLAADYNFTIAGGDTNTWGGPFAINVCMTGVPFQHEPVLRSGCTAGDRLFVTGPLGGSLQNQRHLTFAPRLNTARWLMENVSVHAMMDISDGLAIDLHRMMEASGTGATIDANSIPIHTDVDSRLTHAERQQHALSDGEDFELLFAISSDDAPAMQSVFAEKGIVEIGRITDGTDGIQLRHADDTLSPLTPDGWQHL